METKFLEEKFDSNANGFLPTFFLQTTEKQQENNEASPIEENGDYLQSEPGSSSSQEYFTSDQVEYDQDAKPSSEVDPQNCFYCDVCQDFNADSQEIVKAHIESVHRVFCCSWENCLFKSQHKGNIKRHVQSVHELVRYPCEYCDYQATQKNGLSKHIETTHWDLFYYCENCDFKCETVDVLKDHIESVHGTFCCPIDDCAFKSQHKGNIKRHIQSVHELIRYQCEQCEYQATQKNGLKKHMETVHGYPCSPQKY